jgi:hypothetical protein
MTNQTRDPKSENAKALPAMLFLVRTSFVLFGSVFVKQKAEQRNYIEESSLEFGIRI